MAASSDQNLESKDRARYKSMADDKLSPTAILSNLALIADALVELSELSESLQADSESHCLEP